MLSRGGGVAAFQRVVTRVADLPSPLDAQPGDRIIVRETEEVYGLNSTTRMWEVIGTLKKVGGRKPEELAEHLDGRDNPHRTTLQQVLAESPSADVPNGLTLRGGHKPVVRITGSGTAIRIGDESGELEGLVWANADLSTKTLLRLLVRGVDQFVVSADGSVVSNGSAHFAGGFKGPALFEDEITASEGLFGAKGYDLVLGSDRSVVVRIAGDDLFVISQGGASLSGSLDIQRDLGIGGLVLSNLNPQGKLSLGVQQARWESAALRSLDLAPSAEQSAITVKVQASSKRPALIVQSDAPGDVFALTSSGDLGMGTDSPERRLDVRGTGIVVGPGKARVSLNSALSFNVGVDGKPQDAALASWTIVPGGEQDTFLVTRRSTAGSKNLIQATDAGITLGASTIVSGDLTVSGDLVLGGVSGHGDQSITFSNAGTAYDAASHAFSGSVTITTSSTVPFQVGNALCVKDGDLIGSGLLGTFESPWAAAVFSHNVAIGDTFYCDGVIKAETPILIDAPALSIGSQLNMSGALTQVNILDVLEVRGAGGALVFGVGQYPGITFEGDTPASLYGFGHAEFDSADGAVDPALVVRQTWTKGGRYTASTIEVTDEGSASDSVLADYLVNGRRVAAIHKDRMQLAGTLNVGGLGFNKLQEDLHLDGPRAETKFKIPSGVRVEAVVVQVLGSISGARFIQVGDSADSDRFASPSTELAAGSIIRGLNHCDRGLSVQKTAGPVVVSADAPATGRVRVTVFYVDPHSL